MTVFIHEPDADNEPTIWLLTDGDTDNYRYTALMRRVDLGPSNAHLWPDVVARMTGTELAQAKADRDDWHMRADKASLDAVSARADLRSVKRMHVDAVDRGIQWMDHVIDNAIKGDWVQLIEQVGDDLNGCDAVDDESIARWEQAKEQAISTVARMTGTTITTDDATVRLVARTISEQGGDAGSGLHSWRCEYPERYSPCDCVETTAKLILAALTGVPHA
jgi:hypothetical protein